MSISRFAALVVGLFVALPALAQERDFSQVEIQTVPVADGLYMLIGLGGNIGLSVGEDGAVIIDDQFAPLSDKIKAAIAKVTDKPVRFVVNTHWHGDHVGGNEPFGKSGAVIVAHDNVRVRMATQTLLRGMPLEPAPKAALPVVTFSHNATLHLNGLTMQAMHLPPAHTDGDSIILFKEANVIHTGDLFLTRAYPFVDVESGGRFEGFIENAERILALADDNTKIMPGHGRLASRKDVIEFRDMLLEVKKRVGQLVKQGKTRDEVIAAKPMAEYDAEWGSGFINSDRLLGPVYDALKAAQ